MVGHRRADEQGAKGAIHTPVVWGEEDVHLVKDAFVLEVLEHLAEAIVDRAYQPNGQLVPRSEEGAVHGDIERIQRQAVDLARDAEVSARDGSTVPVRADTLCIHGDTPGAAAAAQLIQLIDTGTAEKIIKLPTELVIRQSCGCDLSSQQSGSCAIFSR